ncbi:class I SAM-dependent methyltransferase [Planococcus salinus]|uniref:SAM-dependent methyltransferase n=1 Tax=Planococcus salinus TaxID=1848460 RepID=A0A3M8P9R0_9BACL|nr:class I SAM-dependent methyltransferase [Planococcus salinus]RNF40445.1 hypothetical protein EEX84_03195 [Planococcus salinus]
MKTVVTTAYRPTPFTLDEAKSVSEQLAIPLVPRNKRSVEKLHQEEQADVLVAAKERLEFYPLGKTEPFFFHPNSSSFRTKRPLHQDPLIEVSKLAKGDVFVDCTLGMASDAIVASQFVGTEGRVVGCESHPILAYVVQQGLQRYQGMPHLHEAMKRVEVVQADAAEYLAGLPSNSVDVVYMDPMFTETISEASNFETIRQTANKDQLSLRWVTEARRVARKTVVLKAHFRSTDFEAYGFVRRVRPNTKFHYGAINCLNG